jgi:hypothetical protein
MQLNGLEPWPVLTKLSIYVKLADLVVFRVEIRLFRVHPSRWPCLE